jgi:FixJ family two-component response regulator
MDEHRSPRIYVVDDDSSVLISLKRLLKSTGYDVTTFESPREFLDSDIAVDAPCCLVLDVMMPEMSGLDLQQEIVSRGLPMPIIFITALYDIPASVSAMKKGAVDFLTKPFEEKDLLEAIRAALQKDQKRRSDSEELRNALRLVNRLTPREQEVLSHVIAGKLNKQIAFDLDISERTVKAHRSQIMFKLDVDSVAGLVRLSEKAGIQPAASSVND